MLSVLLQKIKQDIKDNPTYCLMALVFLGMMILAIIDTCSYEY